MFVHPAFILYSFSRPRVPTEFMTPRSFFNRLLARRHGGVVIFLVLFLAVSMVTRLALLARSAGAVDWNASLVAVAFWGVVFDLGAALLFASPLVLLLTALPAGFFRYRWSRVLAHIGFFLVLYLLWFGAVAEWLFWDEFSVRFNFIAVDYLVYTTEVIANIRESYPMPWIFAGLAAAAAVSHALLVRSGALKIWFEATHEGWRRRWALGAGWAALIVVAGFGLDQSRLPDFANTYNRELAKDGVWSLFAAFWNNELDYNQFYQTLPTDEAFTRIQHELSDDGSRPLAADRRDTLRYVTHEGPELHLNVIQITVESLSASFVSSFNHASHLTPNLEELARKSLVFDHLYATGTRTVRGMEALTLSLPPTPGRSLIKRPHNTGLFTLGSVFRSRGYDTAFIYGGYGYFDNMNAFFGGNGYRIVDRNSVAKTDITFANAWGACDEDLYQWTLREADQAAAAGKPFHFFVMTTSNHRPYTYPEGKIDLPSKLAGRAGGVKYTDYAIGELLRQAADRPWFKNTVFVIVADHCGSVAGKTELPVQNYHIPMFIYAPGGQIAPGHVKALMSQIDVAPTLLGLLHWSYASRFYGWDVCRPDGRRRALIANYQKLGLYADGELTVLRPVGLLDQFAYDPETFELKPEPIDQDRRADIIAYYQTAAWLYRNQAYKVISPEEQADYSRQAAGIK